VREFQKGSPVLVPPVLLFKVKVKHIYKKKKK